MKNGDHVRMLPSRQAEVLRALAAGMSRKQIADMLGICQRTVDLHCTAVFLRLGANNCAAAIRIAVRRKFV